MCDFADTTNFKPYTALSYAWGPPAPTSSILIDGVSYAIRENLYHALLVIRDKITGSRFDWKYLWIDAICINQENVSERNHQVGLMSRIYSRADLVLVWLGSEADNSTMAIELIQRLSQGTSDSGYAYQQFSNRTNLIAVRALCRRPSHEVFSFFAVKTF
jgi:hypothetical protein